MFIAGHPRTKMVRARASPAERVGRHLVTAPDRESKLRRVLVDRGQQSPAVGPEYHSIQFCIFIEVRFYAVKLGRHSRLALESPSLDFIFRDEAQFFIDGFALGSRV